MCVRQIWSLCQKPTGSAQSAKTGNGGKPPVWICPEITKICLPAFSKSHACLVCFHWYKNDAHNYSPPASNVCAKLSELAKLPLILCFPTKQFLFSFVTNYCIIQSTVILLIHCDIFWDGCGYVNISYCNNPNWRILTAKTYIGFLHFALCGLQNLVSGQHCQFSWQQQVNSSPKFLRSSAQIDFAAMSKITDCCNFATPGKWLQSEVSLLQMLVRPSL